VWSSCGSTYCTCVAWCYPYTALVRPLAYSRIKRMHTATWYQKLSLFQLIVWSCKMPFVFSHVEYCDMHFVMGMHMLLLTNTKGVFPTAGFHLGVYFLVFTRQCVRLVVFRVLRCSLKGKWYHWLTHERTFLRWFRDVHVCPLVELPLASACHVCRCGELYMGKIYILIMITEYSIWNQGTLLDVWISATG